MRKDYYNLVHDLKADIVRDIKTIVEEQGGFVAFPTSDEEEEEKVRVQAHVDSVSEDTESAVVGSIEITPNNKCQVNLWKDYIGGWSIELSELSIDGVLTIYDRLTEE